MTKTAEKQFQPLFSGTDPKSVMRHQRQFCITELGAGAKRIASIEGELAKVTAEYKEVGDTLDKIEENRDALREAPVVLLKEYEYVRMQHRDFANKCEELEGQIKALEGASAKVRKDCENMRKNVIFLEDKLSQEAKVINLHGSDRGHRIEG
jgi:chromosome segregation ATPase